MKLLAFHQQAPAGEHHVRKSALMADFDDASLAFNGFLPQSHFSQAPRINAHSKYRRGSPGNSFKHGREVALIGEAAKEGDFR